MRRADIAPAVYKQLHTFVRGQQNSCSRIMSSSVLAPALMSSRCSCVRGLFALPGSTKSRPAASAEGDKAAAPLLLMLGLLSEYPLLGGNGTTGCASCLSAGDELSEGLLFVGDGETGWLLLAFCFCFLAFLAAALALACSSSASSCCARASAASC